MSQEANGTPANIAANIGLDSFRTVAKKFPGIGITFVCFVAIIAGLFLAWRDEKAEHRTDIKEKDAIIEKLHDENTRYMRERDEANNQRVREQARVNEYQQRELDRYRDGERD